MKVKNLRYGMTLVVLLAAGGLLAGCTQSFSDVVQLDEIFTHPQVSARRNLMKAGIAANVRKIGAALKAGKLADGAKAADAIAKAANRIPRAFRTKNLDGKTTALPVIWTKKADFDAKAKRLRTAAAALAVVLKAGDKSAAAGAFKAMRGTCGACHKAYRVPPKKKM